MLHSLWGMGEASLADILVYEDSDLFVFVLLQKQDEASGDWIPENGAVKVDIEVFDPDGVSLGTKSLGGEVEGMGTVVIDGESYGKYRAPFHFAAPGVYRSVSRCEGSGGAKITTRDMVPVDSL